LKGKAQKRKKSQAITLAPMGFEEAVKALLKVPPPKKKGRRKRS